MKLAAIDTPLGKKPMFANTADEARLVFGDDYQQIRIDQAKTLLSVAAKGGSVNPLNELYTTSGMAKALKATSLSFDKAGMIPAISKFSFISKRFITNRKNNFITCNTC